MKNLKFLLVASALVFPGACVANPKGMPLPQMTFANISPMPINVRTVNVHAKPGGKTEGDFIIDPQAAAQNYLKARFAPRGAQDSLEATIEEASVTKNKTPNPGMVESFLAVGGTEDYNVTLRLRLDHTDDTGHVLYGNVLTAHRVLHLSEHASVADREQHEMESLEALFRDIDKEVQTLVLTQMRIAM